LQLSLSAAIVLVVQEVILMTGEAAAEPLDRDTAAGICQQVQAEVRGKPWSAAWWQCWGCRRFSGGDPEKMCIAAQPGYRGCELVNRRVEKGPAGLAGGPAATACR
jgi:hypothetical protein